MDLANLQALRIENAEKALPRPFGRSPRRSGRSNLIPTASLDRYQSGIFISATGQGFLTEDEVDSLTERCCQEAARRPAGRVQKALSENCVVALPTGSSGREMTTGQKVFGCAHSRRADAIVLQLEVGGWIDAELAVPRPI